MSIPTILPHHVPIKIYWFERLQVAKEPEGHHRWINISHSGSPSTYRYFFSFVDHIPNGAPSTIPRLKTNPEPSKMKYTDKDIRRLPPRLTVQPPGVTSPIYPSITHLAPQHKDPRGIQTALGSCIDSATGIFTRSPFRAHPLHSIRLGLVDVNVKTPRFHPALVPP